MITPRRAEDKDRAAIKALWDECFGDSESFTDYFFSRRWAPYYSCVAADGEEIACAMQSWPLTVKVRGVNVPAAMVAGVSTWPKYRGQGIMGKAMAYYMNMLRESGIWVSIHTPVSPKTFFSSLNYPATRTAFLTADRAPQGKMDERIKTGELKSPLDRLYECYCRVAAGYSGMIARSLSDFYLKTEDYAADGARYICREDNEGRVEGYCIFYEMEERLSAEEFIALNDDTRRALLDALYHIAAGRKIRVKLPPDAPLSQEERAMTDVRVQGAMGVAMIEPLLKAVAGRSDLVAEIIDPIVPENAGVFDLGGAKSSKKPHIRLDTGRMGQLLCGFSSIYDLEKEGLAEILDEGAAREIDLALPALPCFIVDEY